MNRIINKLLLGSPVDASQIVVFKGWDWGGRFVKIAMTDWEEVEM